MKSSISYFAKLSLSLALLLICFHSTALAKDNIVCIKGRAVDQYNQAAQGFVKAVGKRAGITRYALSDYEDKEQEVVKLSKDLDPRLIIAIGTEAFNFCLKNFKDKPLIYCMIHDPAKSGISHAAGMTGVSLNIPYEIQFDVMKEINPSLKNVGLLYNPINYDDRVIAEMTKIALQKGITLNVEKVLSTDEISSKFNRIINKIDFLWLIPDATVCNKISISYIFTNSLKKFVPVMGISASYVKAGAVVALVVDYGDIGVQAGEFALRVLDGESVADIMPVDSRTQDIVLNEYPAEIIGIELPRALKKRAKEVFK